MFIIILLRRENNGLFHLFLMPVLEQKLCDAPLTAFDMLKDVEEPLAGPPHVGLKDMDAVHGRNDQFVQAVAVQIEMGHAIDGVGELTPPQDIVVLGSRH